MRRMLHSAHWIFGFQKPVRRSAEKVCLFGLPIALLILATPPSAHADNSPRERSHEEIAGVLRNKGASVGRLVAANVRIHSELSSLPSGNVKDNLQAIGLQYQLQVANASFAVEQLTFTRDLVGVGIAGGMAATGVGAVPAIVGKMAWNAATDYGLHALSSEMTRSSSAYLANNLESWTASVGLDRNSDWSKLPPSELRERLEQANGPLQKLKSALSQNEEGYRIASDAVIATLQKTDYATLERLAQQNAQIQNAQRELEKHSAQIADFKKQASKELQRQGDQIAQLTREFGETSAALGRLQSALDANTAQTRAIADVLFANMSPREKLAALRGPLLAHVDTQSKLDLEKVLKSEVKKQETLENLTRVVSGLASVHAIATNLGFESRELTAAVQLATVAQTTVSQAVAGNYLGALASATSLFGSRTDPNAERHGQLMSFLRSAFEEVNAKLNEIVENQKKMAEAIAGLSEQASEYNRALHQRLDRMEFEQKRILEGVQSILWQKYIDCQNAYQHSSMAWKDAEGNARYARFDRELAFESYDHIKHVQNRASDHVKACIKSAADFWTGAKINKTFGQLIALRAVREPSKQVLDEMAKADRDKLADSKQYYLPTDIESFLNDLYSPLLAIVLEDALKEWPHGPKGIAHQLISSLAPSRSLSDYREKHAEIGNRSRKLCGSETELNGRWYELLCNPTVMYPQKTGIPSTSAIEAEATNRLLSHLREPLSVDVLEQVNLWTVFAAAYSDWLSPEGDALQTPDQMLRSQHRSRGRDLVYGALGITDIAIAQYALAYGDASSRILFGILWDSAKNAFASPDTDLSKRAHTLLKVNPYLARNVFMWALDTATRSSGLTSSTSYQFALNLLESDGPASTPDALRVLVGESDTSKPSQLWRFERRKSDGRGQLVWGDLTIPLPTVEEYRDRRLVYPVRLMRLENWRTRLAEKQADYLVFEKFKLETIRDLVRFLKD